MTPHGRILPLRAFVQGVSAVLRAPLLIAAVSVVTMLVAVPFAIVLGTRVQASLASQPPVALSETEIDPEWWQEFRAQARGLEATFTPAVLGFAAPLDSISAVLDGRRPPLAVLGPLALSIVLWAFLWGGILRRFAAGHRIGLRAFVDAGFQFAPRFAAIAIAAAVLIVILYLTVHAMLFGPVYRAFVSETSPARDALLARVVLYAVFLVPLVLIGLVADYARVASVAGTVVSLGGALRDGLAFVGANLRAVVTLWFTTASLFAAVTIAYGMLEIYGGSQVGGWRAIAIGQAYIVVRLTIRLIVAASELRLFAMRAMPQSPNTAPASYVSAGLAARPSDRPPPPQPTA